MAPAGEVLVIEDDASCRRFCRRALERAGYAVAEADSAKRAIELARERLPDAVLLDLVLPDGNGFQAMDILRADPETADVPVLMMTGQHDPGELLKTAAVRYDARDFLYKPFPMEELLRRVAQLVSNPSSASETVFRRGRFEFDLAHREVRWCGKCRRLGAAQGALLCALLSGGGPVERKDLLREVWSGSENAATVNMAVARLRKSLAFVAGFEIRAVQGGYQILFSSDDLGS